MSKRVTLKHIEDFTLQEIFDKVAGHLLKQKRKAENAGQCLYTMVEDHKVYTCAVGCLIPKADYKKSIEGRSSADAYNIITGKSLYNYGERKDLLSALQTCHDSRAVSHWRGELELIAERYKLEWKFKAKK